MNDLPTTSPGWAEHVQELTSQKAAAEGYVAELAAQRGDLALDGTDDARRAHRVKMVDAMLAVDEIADAITAAERRRDECAAREEAARIDAKRAEFRKVADARVEICRRLDSALAAIDKHVQALKENTTEINRLREDGVHQINQTTLMSKRWFPAAIAAVAPALSIELDAYVNPARRMSLEAGQRGLMSGNSTSIALVENDSEQDAAA